MENIVRWSDEYAQPGDGQFILVVIEDLGDRVKVCEKPIAQGRGGIIERGVTQIVSKSMITNLN